MSPLTCQLSKPTLIILISITFVDSYLEFRKSFELINFEYEDNVSISLRSNSGNSKNIARELEKILREFLIRRSISDIDWDSFRVYGFDEPLSMLIKNKTVGRELPKAGIDNSLNFLIKRSLSIEYGRTPAYIGNSTGAVFTILTTFPEPGVSRMVAVDVDQAVEMAAS